MANQIAPETQEEMQRKFWRQLRMDIEIRPEPELKPGMILVDPAGSLRDCFVLRRLFERCYGHGVVGEV